MASAICDEILKLSATIREIPRDLGVAAATQRTDD